ncbi:M48 family metalloprotease [Geodermatophilus sp. DSM 44513]|uniref:M48 family metalloprotease n=1 Tax=Geodermatophilus sp. DSM 44513 TaxID=1528104 RepID=UPI0012810F6A|nr:M48 family metalloprotease [Geodermatophilus sp. DSM 44513]WNV76138.1 M48 family metalloprotease [Geodermatophilus sp. DSM 44513]
MATDEREDEARLLRARLRVLAARSGLPLPALDVVEDPRGRLLPATVQGGADGEDHVVVSSTLLRETPDAQTWHLATALGHWASPVPRRRRRQGWVVGGLLATLWVGSGLAELAGVVDLPGAATLAVTTTVGLLSPVAAAALSRRTRAACDAAGREVLRRAGHDPGTLTRQVFGGRPDPSRWARLHAREPTPSARVAAAQREGGPGVAPPLY